LIRQRILAEPELFLKAQRQLEPQATTAPLAALLRDLEMVVATVNRASRRLAGAGMDRGQCEDARRKIDRARHQLNHLSEQIQKEQEPHVEPSTTQHDSELNTQRVTKREIARILGISRLTVRKVLRTNSSDVPESHRAEKAEPYRQQIRSWSF
jgi:hypothetical protein